MNDIEFFRMEGWDQTIWYTYNSPYSVFEWAQENNVRYLTAYHDSSIIGIKLLDDDSSIYFMLRWGG